MANSGPRGPSYQSIEFLVAILCTSLGSGQGRVGGERWRGAWGGAEERGHFPPSPSLSALSGSRVSPHKGLGECCGLGHTGEVANWRNRGTTPGTQGPLLPIPRACPAPQASSPIAPNLPRTVPSWESEPLPRALERPLSGSLLGPPPWGRCTRVLLLRGSF